MLYHLTYSFKFAILYFIFQRIAASEVFKESLVEKARVAHEKEVTCILAYEPADLFDTYSKALAVCTVFGMLRVDDCRQLTQKSVVLVTNFSNFATCMR